MTEIVDVRDGYVVRCDSTDELVIDSIMVELNVDKVPLIIADPPYGNVVNETWDQTSLTDELFASWMVEWTRLWTQYLHPGGAFYVWGGTGSPGFRPFFRYLSTAEIPGEFELANLITWKKRRGYGVQNNYLYTREECAFFVNGNAKKPRTFHVPYLDEERGYAGYNEKYPAKDSRFRRTNVWTDITEIMRGKIHPTQKQQKLHEIMIEVHTDVGEYVIDPFAGSGVTALAARKLGRKFIIIENDVEHFDATVKRLEKQDE